MIFDFADESGGSADWVFNGQSTLGNEGLTFVIFGGRAPVTFEAFQNLIPEFGPEFGFYA